MGDIEMPNTVKVYNKNIERVDLVDGLISLYRITTRSRKWCHKLLPHSLDMVIVNSWNLYRRDAELLNIEEK